MPTLTPRQKQIFDFVKKYINKNSISPTFEEIRKHLHLRAFSTAHEHVEELIKKGFLSKIDNSSRAIQLVEQSGIIKISLLGTIAAGQPIEAVEEKETMAIPRNKFVHGGNFFALKVKGDSMVEENINDGDYVVIKQQNNAEDGQKVVALINDSEATLKKIYREKNRIRLQPANSDYKPIYVDASELKIQGVVVDIIKNIYSGTSSESILSKPEVQQKKEFVEENQIMCGDAIKLLDTVRPDSVHLVLSDIPYGIALDEWDVLHANTNSALLGKSPAQEGKNAFKRRGKPINGWSSADRNIPKEYQNWCYSWSKKLFPLVKEGGSLFIFGARRTLHRALIAFEESGFLVRDVLAWEKPSAHHRAQAISGILEKRGLEKEAKDWQGWKLGNLAPKYEPVAWLFKPYQLTVTDNVLKNQVGAMNVRDCLIDGKSPTNILRFGFDSNEGGLHEAQKPTALLEYLIKLVTKKDQVVLDPFLGSGSTALAAKNIGRKYIGFEISDSYCEIAKKRLASPIKISKKNIHHSGQKPLF